MTSIEKLQGRNAAMKAALLSLERDLEYQGKQWARARDAQAQCAAHGARESASRIRELIKVIDGDDRRTRSVLSGLPSEVAYDDPQPDLSKPVPLVMRRAQDGEEPNFWAAGKRLQPTEYWALKSMRMDTPEYEEYTRACAFLSLKVVTDHAGYVTYGEVFEPSVEDLLDSLDGEPPSYVYACREEAFEPPFEDWIDSYLCDQHHEDAHEQLLGEKEFYAAGEAFRKKNAHVITFWESNEVIVVDQERFDAERAEAQRIIATWKEQDQ